MAQMNPPSDPAGSAQPLWYGDFHMHTWFSADCVTPPRSLVRRAIKVGLNCIAVTDHNSIKGGLAVQKIAPPELTVIVAAEVRTTHGEITGLFLKEEIPSRISPLETVKRIRGQGGLVSLPHPFDRVRHYVLKPEVFEEILPYVDIVEVFNARTTFRSDSARGLDFAKQHSLLQGAGTDSHFAWELGHVKLEMPPFDGSPEGFKASLRQGRVTARPSTPLVHAVSRFNKIRRKYFPSSLKR